jgi:putative transcriptional regulator
MEDGEMARKLDEENVYKDIVSGLNDAISYEKKGTPKGIRTRRVTIAPVPHYGATTVKSIRNMLGLSQIAFAEALGVSKKTVEAWEAGTNVPQGPAQRILELLQKEHNLLEKHEILIT